MTRNLLEIKAEKVENPSMASSPLTSKFFTVGEDEIHLSRYFIYIVDYKLISLI